MEVLPRRRMLMAGSVLLATASATRACETSTRRDRLKIVVTGGHPGDPEYGCGGTIARLTELGNEVVLLYLNEGVVAGAPKDEVRVKEAHQACEILKARPMFAGQVDGEAVVDRAHYESFTKIVEREAPDLLLTHWPIDNHADHRAMAMLAYEAWLRLGRRFVLTYYEVSNGEDTVQFTPTRYVDITTTADTKRRACFAHVSQTPERFFELQERVTRMRGVEKGCEQAEGFVRHVQSPDVTLPLGL